MPSDALTLHHGEAFLICSSDAAIDPGSAHGYFTRDTRLVSGWRLTVDGRMPTVVASRALPRRARIELAVTAARSRLTIDRTLGDDGVRDVITISTDGAARSVELRFDLAFDFADVFEVRGLEPGRDRQVKIDVTDTSGIRATYRNGEFARGVVVDVLAPGGARTRADRRGIRLAADIRPGVGWRAVMTWRPMPTGALAAAAAAAEPPSSAVAPVSFATDLEAVERAVETAHRDLVSLALPIPVHDGTRDVLAAGVPWYMALFGRDSLVAGMDAAWSFPRYLRGTLEALAELQAATDDPERDADPGKILHELRRGELATLGELPWSPYYGGHESTSLFIIAAASYLDWTGDAAFVAGLRPNLEAALGWIERYGDRDGDGFQEYATRSSRGFRNQGWKDSHDGIVDGAGQAARGPIALCEHQALAYAAKSRMATLFDAWRDGAAAERVRRSASSLCDRFNEAFWWEAEGTYYLGLDGDGRPLESVASNAGQCLATGIVPPDRAARVVSRLMADDMFSGWGVRTLSAAHPAYDPMSYHRGSVWPHDNAAIAAGFAATGHPEEAARIAAGIFAAASEMEGFRIPELLGGGPEASEPPIRPPEANAPQAWAASALLRLVGVLCGLQPSAPTGKLYADPALPEWLPELKITGLRAGTGSVDLRFHEREMEVLNNTTGLEIVHGPSEGGPM